MNFEGAPEIDFRSPQAPSEVKRLYFHWRVVQKRRSSFLPQSAPKVDFGSHFGTQKGPKIFKKRGGGVPGSQNREKCAESPKVATRWSMAIVQVNNGSHFFNIFSNFGVPLGTPKPPPDRLFPPQAIPGSAFLSIFAANAVFLDSRSILGGSEP